MRFISHAAIAFFAFVPAAFAEEAPMRMDHSMHMNHAMPMAPMAADNRQAVAYPPEMRVRTLADMRDHLSALSEILLAVSQGRLAKAAEIADERLGMESASAGGCMAEGMGGGAMMSTAPNMEQQMAQVMPEGMRAMGREMHALASAFAVAAKKAAKTGNQKPAMVALSRMVQQCAACHSAYKVQ